MPVRARTLSILCLGPVAVVFLLCAAPRVQAQALSPGPEEAAASAATFEDLVARAQAGDAGAACEVGVAYLNGTRVAQDFRQGLAWLVLSSDLAFGYARYVLADVYSRGYAGVPISDENAYYYASLAAAASSLPESYRQRAVKLRNACAKRLTAAQIASLQARAALAPLDAAGHPATGQ
uniref:Sel1 repeat protein n=1 Tax=Desulfovibrio sp. U5L TaxID=596152 RepID=I2Q153_9BACT